MTDVDADPEPDSRADPRGWQAWLGRKLRREDRAAVLEAAAELKRAEERLAMLVRRVGYAEAGRLLGVSRQAARQRFGPRDSVTPR